VLVSEIEAQLSSSLHFCYTTVKPQSLPRAQWIANGTRSIMRTKAASTIHMHSVSWHYGMKYWYEYEYVWCAVSCGIFYLLHAHCLFVGLGLDNHYQISLYACVVIFSLFQKLYFCILYTSTCMLTFGSFWNANSFLSIIAGGYLVILYYGYVLTLQNR